jgi:hypothetical protein
VDVEEEVELWESHGSDPVELEEEWFVLDEFESDSFDGTLVGGRVGMDCWGAVGLNENTVG